MRCSSSCERAAGFTLIEVAFAVTILGIALTTLVALQSGYLRAYSNQRNLVRAALAAQYLLAVWEADDNLPTPGESSKPLAPILEKLGYFSESPLMVNNQSEYEGWILHRAVSNIGIPPLDNALQKIQLDVDWGESSNEQFSIVYFVKGLKTSESNENQSQSVTGTGG